MIRSAVTVSCFTLPVCSSTCHPITLKPVEVIARFPAASTKNEPSRVIKFSLPLLTMKNASPVIRTSNGLFVVCAEPGCVIAVLIAPDTTPRPICFGFLPAVPVVAFGPDAAAEVWYINSEKLIDIDL